MYEPLIEKLRARFDNLADNQQWGKAGAILDSLAMVAVEACYQAGEGQPEALRDIEKVADLVHDLNTRVEVDHLPIRDDVSPAMVADQLRGLSRVLGYASRNPAPAAARRESVAALSAGLT